MRHLIYGAVALLAGFGLTVLFYLVGEPLASPAMFLARAFLISINGEPSLLPAFTVINTLLCSIVIYVALLWVTNAYRPSGR